MKGPEKRKGWGRAEGEAPEIKDVGEKGRDRTAKGPKALS